MYTAVPRRSQCCPGVLVLHSWWGLNEFFRRFCDRLAAAGFVALAPDLFGGKVANTEAEARSLRAQASAARKEPAYRYLIRMIGELAEHGTVKAGGIAVVGFSMGGHWAYWLAQRPELPIAATVTFYAVRNGTYASSNSSFLAHFAEDDPWVSRASIRKLDKSMTAAGKEHQFHTYPGTRHWFFEENRADAFDAGASELAWERTITFMRQTIGQQAPATLRHETRRG